MNLDHLCGSICSVVACIFRATATAAYWSIIVSFFQALMWHFTEPYTSGFAIFPLIVFLACIIIPAIFVATPIETGQHTSKILVIMRMIPLILLLICELPAVGHYARSLCLASAVIVLQTYAFYPQKPNDSKTGTQFFELDNREDIVVSTPTNDNNNSKCSSMVQKQSANCKTFQSKTLPTCIDLLIGMLIVVSVRWCALSINVFLESWVAGTVALICFIAHENMSFFATASCGKYVKRAFAGNSVITKTPKSAPYTQHDPTTQDDPKTKFTCSILFGMAINNSAGMATLLQLCVWTIASPAYLSRWCMIPLYPHGLLIPITFFIAICVLLGIEQYFAHCKNQKVLKIRIVKTILLPTLPLGFVICGFALVVYSKSLVGIVLLCVSLPTIIFNNVNYVSELLCILNEIPRNIFKRLIKAIFVVIFGAMVFLYFIIYISFQNPRYFTGFQGRYDIIIWMQLALLCAATTFNILFTLYSSPEHNYKTEEKLKKNNLIYMISSLILLISIICTGTAIYTRNTNKPCQMKDNDSFKVLTWNILLGHTMNGSNNLGDISDLITYHEPDVVGLQEADPWQAFWGGKDSWGFFQSTIGNCYHQYSGANPEESLLGIGLLSRSKASHNKNQPFPTDESLKIPLYGFNKISLNITRKSSNYTLHIYTLHALYKNWTCPKKRPESVISCEQMRALANDVKTLPVTEPVIVMGDFNINPNEPELDLWYDENFGFKSALSPDRNTNLNRPKLDISEDCKNIEQFYANFTKCDSNDFSYESTILNRHAQVDHIFYRGLTLKNTSILPNMLYSDHKPVIAEFLL